MDDGTKANILFAAMCLGVLGFVLGVIFGVIPLPGCDAPSIPVLICR